MLRATIAAIPRVLSPPILQWPSSARMSRPRFGTLSGGCSPHLRKLVAQLADLDRALNNTGVEHRIVIDQAFERIGAGKLAGNAGAEHLEMTRLPDNSVSASFERAHCGARIGS